MPGCLHKSELLPRQEPSQTLATVAYAVIGFLGITGAVVITLSVVMEASLSLFWGLINTLQILAFLQLLQRALFPANANVIN